LIAINQSIRLQIIARLFGILAVMHLREVMIKAYVNYYLEISYLPLEEQESLLDNARYEVL